MTLRRRYLEELLSCTTFLREFSGSISTPARPTFNTSKNTPGGTNLNDILVKGAPNLVSWINMMLEFVAGQGQYVEIFPNSTMKLFWIKTPYCIRDLCIGRDKIQIHYCLRNSFAY